MVGIYILSRFVLQPPEKIFSDKLSTEEREMKRIKWKGKRKKRKHE